MTAFAAMRLEIYNEFMSAQQDRFALLFTQTLVVRSELPQALECAHELMDENCRLAIRHNG